MRISYGDPRGGEVGVYVCEGPLVSMAGMMVLNPLKGKERDRERG